MTVDFDDNGGIVKLAIQWNNLIFEAKLAVADRVTNMARWDNVV